MIELKIFTNVIDDTHQDAYWYDGILAETKHYQLWATGEIQISQSAHDKGWENPRNDKEVARLFKNDMFRLNNWFEVVPLDEDGNEIESCGDMVCGNFTDALQMLISAESEYQLTSKCIYCGRETTEPHFESKCCGRGMCDYCYDALVGTEEQIQLDYADEELLDTIKDEYADAEYLCYECADIWKKKGGE